MMDSGGIGSYIKELLPFFLRDYECTLLVFEKDFKTLNEIISRTEERFGEISTYAVHICDIKPFSIKELLFFPRDLISAINESEIFWTPYCNIPGNLFKKIKPPIFSTIHDVVFLDVKLSGRLGTFARKWFYAHACKKSKAIFTVSEFSKQRIIHHLKTKKPIFVTHSAIQPFLEGKTSCPSRASASVVTEPVEVTGGSANSPLLVAASKSNSILFVGNIKKHKGLRTLLGALKILVAENFDARLVIVGNSQNFRTGDTTIQNEIDSFPPEKVVFTGKISDAELKKHYETARLLVQPSFYEGFGLPPLEALTCGTNAVVSDIEVFKEIYADFPVTFFKTGDEKDLAEKIKAAFDLPSPTDFPKIYTFEATYKKILAGLNG